MHNLCNVICIYVFRDDYLLLDIELVCSLEKTISSTLIILYLPIVLCVRVRHPEFYPSQVCVCVCLCACAHTRVSFLFLLRTMIVYFFNAFRQCLYPTIRKIWWPESINLYRLIISWWIWFLPSHCRWNITRISILLNSWGIKFFVGTFKGDILKILSILSPN